MARSTEQVQKEFDRIALLSEREQDPGSIYARFLLRCVPERPDRVLEIGCGTGAFTRLLAAKANSVTAIDLSPEMIRLARQRSASYSNISYQVEDLLQADLSDGAFDCVITVATLHHLPLNSALEKMKLALRPGGTLIIHDLLQSDKGLDKAMDLLRLPMNMSVRLLRTGRLLPRREVRRAWAEHGKGERYLTMRQVRTISECHLPGAYLKRHLLWRYTLAWHRPNLYGEGMKY